MESQVDRAPGAPDSRRARREAQDGTKHRRRPEIPTHHRWAPRMAILGALAVATIAVPLGAGAQDNAIVTATAAPEAAAPVGPSALDIVRTALAPAAASEFVAASPDVRRVATAASRSSDRDPLPGCDPNVRPTGANGQLNPAQLCQLWQPDESLRPDAAVSLTALNEDFRANFGRDLCLVASYRSLSRQVSLQYTRGGFAARPGTSMHGWGLAIDLCSSETGSKDVYGWINKNGARFGWANPAWAKGGGNGAFEPWHFEYTQGVEELEDGA